jgi:hypothetical protein
MAVAVAAQDTLWNWQSIDRKLISDQMRTHVHVSKRHLAKYLAEFEFRWNLRNAPNAMFPLLLKRLAT